MNRRTRPIDRYVQVIKVKFDNTAGQRWSRCVRILLYVFASILCTNSGRVVKSECGWVYLVCTLYILLKWFNIHVPLFDSESVILLSSYCIHFKSNVSCSKNRWLSHFRGHITRQKGATLVRLVQRRLTTLIRRVVPVFLDL